jgi:hypothetical protein
VKTTHIATAAAFVAFVTLATAAQAQIYKWVDEKGVTHYSESPPANGGKSSQVTVQDPAPPSQSQPQPYKDGPKQWADKELEFRKRQLDRQAMDKNDEQRKVAQAAECTRARNSLEYQSQRGSFYERNEKGEKVYRTEEQQAAVVAAARKRVDEVCR